MRSATTPSTPGRWPTAGTRSQAPPSTAPPTVRTPTRRAPSPRPPGSTPTWSAPTASGVSRPAGTGGRAGYGSLPDPDHLAAGRAQLRAHAAGRGDAAVGDVDGAI